MKVLIQARQLILGAIAVALIAHPGPSRAEVTNNPPDFREVYDLIQSHLEGATEANLNRAAVQGLIAQLRPKVALVSSSNEPIAPSEGPLLVKSLLYDGPIAYLRVARVEAGLANQVAAANKALSGTNELKGVVLDLRFADGHDYAEAVAAAGLFISEEKPLLDWGAGYVRSKANTDAVTLPVAIMVNQQTAGAAEALAAILRETDRGLILGATTAGEATVGKEYPLKNGQYLRIASAAIKLGDGEVLSTSGVNPDIRVMVGPSEERVYFADPFKEVPAPARLLASFGATATGAAAGTNRPPRARTTEADLIRERKERPGADLEVPYLGPSVAPSGPDAERDRPVIRDPVLGRALDLIKGISAIRNSRHS
jgi:hypothetical protein